MKNNDKLLPVSIVAKRLTISISSVYRAIESGSIRVVRVTGRKGYRVTESDLEQYMSECRAD